MRVSLPVPDQEITRAGRPGKRQHADRDQLYKQAIDINPSSNIVRRERMIGVAAINFNELNAPYDAKVVGDYTGLTLP